MRAHIRLSSSRLAAQSFVAWVMAMAVATVLALVALWALWPVALLIYAAALFATGVSPLVRIVERQTLIPVGGRRRPPRWMAILVVYSALVALLALALLAVCPPLFAQLEGFAIAMPHLLQSVRAFLRSRGMERITLGAMAETMPDGGDVVNAAWTAASSVVGGLVGLAVILILAFYLLVEADDLRAAFVRLFPWHQRPRVGRVIERIAAKVGAWLNAQLVLAGVIGLSSAIFLGLMGVPYFYVLATITAAGELVPYLGPLLAAIPAVAIALGVSWQLAVATAAFFFVQQQIENYVLVPKVMGHGVGLSAVTIVIAVLAGGSLLGVAGAILAVPTAAIAHVLLQELQAARDERAARRRDCDDGRGSRRPPSHHRPARRANARAV
jgi:predicted PurR-regulated permease PerM